MSLQSSRLFNCIIKTSRPIKLINHRLSNFLLQFKTSFSLTSQPKMEVCIVPVLEDNYSYILADKTTRQAAFVDPVEPKKVLGKFSEQYPDYTLTSVITTHHHWDHSGGNEELLKIKPGLKVYGGDERIPSLTDKVTNDQTFQIGDINLKCIFTPGHTMGHICFYAEKPDSEHPVLFTGDTLFIGGCGRFFEGTPENMYDSLTILSQLPMNTKIYCGHEYTLSNLKFAVAVEPENECLQKKFAWAETTTCTIPSTLKEELDYNPFMRVEVPTFQYAHDFKGEPIKFMEYLRNKKNNF